MASGCWKAPKPKFPSLTKRTSQTTKDEGQEILCLLGRRWARAQRVLVRYDAETKTVLSYLCELVQRASERSYLAKRGLKIHVNGGA